MPFDLFITSSEGRTFKSMRSPYPTRRAADRIVRICASSEHETEGQLDAFVEQVLAAPLGETVHHEATGIAFRTEETEESA